MRSLSIMIVSSINQNPGFKYDMDRPSPIFPVSLIFIVFRDAGDDHSPRHDASELVPGIQVDIQASLKVDCRAACTSQCDFDHASRQTRKLRLRQMVGNVRRRKKLVNHRLPQVHA